MESHRTRAPKPRIDGFIIWGPVLYEKHKGEDPVQLARQMFGQSGSYTRYLYPGREPRRTDTAS